MKKKGRGKKKKGFTLIELLVVIAIIGLLATLAVVSMSSARAKARDAKRISDIRQMSTIIDVEDAANPATSTTGNLTGCTGQRVLANTCTGPGDVSAFANFTDPTTPGTACNAAPTATCGYAMARGDGGANANTANYQICFWLEQPSSGLLAGEKRIGTSGVINDNCQ